MSLLDKASLIVTPNAYEESKLYSVVPNTTLGDMDVVRATTATRVNASGLIESVGLNIPRIDYTNGSCPSILVEPQRTNLVFPSATLTTQTRTVTAAANTLSFYGTGTIVLSGVHIATLTGTGANNRVSLTFTPTAGSLILTVTGTVTNAQLELGSYATSYIPTVASSVTRNADVISKTGISSLIGQTEGTLFCDVNLNSRANFTYFAIATNLALTNNYLGIAFLNNAITFDSVVAGALQANIIHSNTSTGRFKIAAAYKANDFVLYINGTQIGVDTSGTVPTCSEIGLSVFNQAQALNYNSAQIYKTRLTNEQCILLTGDTYNSYAEMATNLNYILQ